MRVYLSIEEANSERWRKTVSVHREKQRYSIRRHVITAVFWKRSQ